MQTGDDTNSDSDGDTHADADTYSITDSNANTDSISDASDKLCRSADGPNRVVSGRWESA